MFITNSGSKSHCLGEKVLLRMDGKARLQAASGIKNPIRNNPQQVPNSHLDGHPRAVQPKGKQAAPPLQPLVPDCELQTGKMEQLTREQPQAGPARARTQGWLLQHTATDRWVQHRAGESSGRKVKSEFAPSPTPWLHRQGRAAFQAGSTTQQGLQKEGCWGILPTSAPNLLPHRSRSSASTNKRDRSLGKFGPFSRTS